MIDKHKCKFYSEERKRCNALTACYCERDEEKPCSFYKPRNETKETEDESGKE